MTAEMNVAVRRKVSNVFVILKLWELSIIEPVLILRQIRIYKTELRWQRKYT